jgi:metal-responsive CopG/Arc/MetJ family transcriptional regulator
MQSQKLSISLPSSLVTFVEHYKAIAGCQSRSMVIVEALQLLQERELEQAYRYASQEVDPLWDVTVKDGLTDETW